MDLSPRPAAAVVPPTARNRRKMMSIGLLVLVLIAGGVVIAKFLTNSLDYYCNVDEVGHKSGCEAGRRLRIQGVVDKGSIKSDNGVTTFSITFNKVTVPVIYDSGEPGGLFQECIPVVVHGVMKAGTFEGDDVEVKHSNEYNAKNKDRVAKANAQAAACSQSS
jgi:cytochrome c-type biogenesis protein CcmE